MGPQGKQGFPGAQGREVRALEFDQKSNSNHYALDFSVTWMFTFLKNIFFMSCCQGYKGTKGVRGQGGDPGPEVSSFHLLTSYSYLDYLDPLLIGSLHFLAFSHSIGWSWTWWRGWWIWFLGCNGEWKIDLTDTIWLYLGMSIEAVLIYAL